MAPIRVYGYVPTRTGELIEFDLFDLALPPSEPLEAIAAAVGGWENLIVTHADYGPVGDTGPVAWRRPRGAG